MQQPFACFSRIVPIAKRCPSTSIGPFCCFSSDASDRMCRQPGGPIGRSAVAWDVKHAFAAGHGVLFWGAAGVGHLALDADRLDHTWILPLDSNWCGASPWWGRRAATGSASQASTTCGGLRAFFFVPVVHWSLSTRGRVRPSAQHVASVASRDAMRR